MKYRVLLPLLIAVMVPRSLIAAPPNLIGIEIEEMLEDEVSAVAGPVIGPGIPIGPIILPQAGGARILDMSDEDLRNRPPWLRRRIEAMRRRLERGSHR